MDSRRDAQASPNAPHSRNAPADLLAAHSSDARHAQSTNGSHAGPGVDVSALAELLRGDEAPATSVGLLRVILDLSPDAVVIIGPDGRIVLVNRHTELVFGYTQDDLLGHVVERLIPTRFHTAHRRHRRRYGSDPRTRPMGTALHLFGSRKDGSEFPVEVSLNPVAVSGSLLVIATIRDVTERKALEDALRASERLTHQETVARLALLQTILDEIPLGIYLVRGTDARLVLANRAVTDIWGADWPVGQPFEAFLNDVGTRVLSMSGEPLAGDELATLRALRGRAPARSQQEVLRRRDGTTLPVLVNAIPLDPHVIGRAESLPDEAAEPVALVVHADVTALREAEHLKDEFVAMAAHELRHPMGILFRLRQHVAPWGFGRRSRDGRTRRLEG